jgi:hypothetical protein
MGGAKNLKLPPVRHQFLIFWALLSLIVIAFTDLKLPDLLGQSDYLMTFHTAGYIASHGLWDILYPQAGAVSFAGAPFDKQAHALLPQMPSWSVAEYMYMPLSAYIFAPFSQLTPTASLIWWQLTSLGALYLGNVLTLGRGQKALLATCAAFAFIPLVFTLWIGQVGLVFALLPLAAGYHLLTRKQYFFAGLVFALLILKPQMLVPALFMVVLELGRKHFAPLGGLITGTMIMAQLNYGLAGEALCNAWLRCLALSDKIYSDPGQGVAVHLATSLPRAILLSQPLATHAFIKPALYLLAFVLLLAGLAATVKLARSALDDQDKVKYSFILGALALPMVVPHLFLYDLGALVPAALLLFFEAPKDGDPDHVPDHKKDSTKGNNGPVLYRAFKSILVLEWLTITAYCLALVINKDFAPPLLLVAIMLGSYLAAVTIALRTK